MRRMTNLNDEARARWDLNAAFWDERMGEGNKFHRQLLEPALLALLELQPGARTLEIACGNGQLARKLASLGARVVATDFSPNMLAQARAHPQPVNAQVEYRLLDATDGIALHTLEANSFDAVVCNMALMDMADIAPLFSQIPHLLTARGRFVFSLLHPCFNASGVRLTIEEEERDGTLVETRALKLTRYLSPHTEQGLAIIGQPVPHYYFFRPLHELLGTAFRAGLVMDGFLEPAFPSSETDPHWHSWVNYHEFPPTLVVRLRTQAVVSAIPARPTTPGD